MLATASASPAAALTGGDDMDHTQALQHFIAHLDLSRTRDRVGLRAIYHDEVSYYDPIGGKLAGGDAVVDYLISLCSRFEVLELDVVNIWLHNEQTVVERLQRSELDGVQKTQRGMTVLATSDGRLIEHRDFFTLGRPPWADELRSHLVLPVVG
jgi:hypothetical protein